jgi:MFS family permease
MGAIETIAIIIGPVLGGILTDRVSWRWCFYINLPIGAVVIAVIVFLVRIPPQSGNRETNTMSMLGDFDIIGAIFMMAAVISFFLTLQWGGIKYPWGNARIISLLAVSSVLTVLFVLIQLRRKETALLPPRILRQRSTALGAWYGFSAGAALSTLENYVSKHTLALCSVLLTTLINQVTNLVPSCQRRIRY